MSLSQQAYLKLKDKIITLQLAPGSILNEAQLLDELGLGRTPVREALQRLEREQLVRIVARRGIFVADIDLGDLQRLFEMRVPLEGLAVQLAAERGTTAHWQAMQELLQRAHDHEDDDREALLAIDHGCHALFWAAADNQFLHDTLKILYDWSLRLWHYALPQVVDLRKAVLEHQEMLDALQRTQSDLAVRQMQFHIRSFQQTIEAAILARAETGD
jgi:DNA-binding GntR family transcriptional regulator